MQEAGIPGVPASCSCIQSYRGVTHPGRTLTARERGVCRGLRSTPHAPTRHQEAGGRSRSRGEVGFTCRLLLPSASCALSARVPGTGLLNRTLKSRAEGVRFNSSAGFHKSIRKIRCGVAQAGKSVRLINERLRVRIPPPRPITSPESNVQSPKSSKSRRRWTLDLRLWTDSEGL